MHIGCRTSRWEQLRLVTDAQARVLQSLYGLISAPPFLTPVSLNRGLCLTRHPAMLSCAKGRTELRTHVWLHANTLEHDGTLHFAAAILPPVRRNSMHSGTRHRSRCRPLRYHIPGQDTCFVRPDGRLLSLRQEVHQASLAHMRHASMRSLERRTEHTLWQYSCQF